MPRNTPKTSKLTTLTVGQLRELETANVEKIEKTTIPLLPLVCQRFYNLFQCLVLCFSRQCCLPICVCYFPCLTVLQSHDWTFYFDDGCYHGNKAKSFMDNLTKLGTVNNVKVCKSRSLLCQMSVVIAGANEVVVFFWWLCAIVFLGKFQCYFVEFRER